MTAQEAKKFNLVTTGDQPTRDEAETAVRVLIRWAGDDPNREGLIDTPARVARSFEEYFSGYHEDAGAMLARVFEETSGYSDMIMLNSIEFISHCEHHIVPIVGKASLAYIPDRRIVGISKLARVVDIFARRLQTQEAMTAQVATTIQTTLAPKGVAVLVDATHQCMTTRGVHKKDVSMVTSHFTGLFAEDSDLRERFLGQAKT